MKSGELRRNSNEGTEENAPRNEAQIVDGRSKVGRALTTSSISSFWHSFARLDRSVDKILQFMPNSSTLLGPFVLQSMISQSVSPSFRNMRTFRCIYCLLSSPLLCVGGGNKKAYLHTIARGLNGFGLGGKTKMNGERPVFELPPLSKICPS